MEVLFDYITERKQYVRVENFKSDEIEATSGVPQRSLPGSLLFCSFINNLPDLLKFREIDIFADDLKFICVGEKRDEIQEDVTSFKELSIFSQ